MPNLKDSIKAVIENGELSDVFQTRDITSLNSKDKYCVVNGQKYRKDSVRQILANHSVGPGTRKGESIKRGQEILFVKLGRGRYSLFEGDGSDPGLEMGEGQGESAKEVIAQNVGSAGGSTDEEDAKNTIAEKFVEYLREKPYRICTNTRNGGSWLPENGPVCGWQNRLGEYQWRGLDWNDTKEVLDGFVMRLGALRCDRGNDVNNEEKQAKIIYDDIRRWGNPKGTRRHGEFVMARLNELWDGRITKVDSTLTKIYALAMPDNYVIYDSRVATAILSIAEDIFRYRTINKRRVETVNTQFHGYYKALGVYDGSGGTRPRGFR